MMIPAVISAAAATGISAPWPPPDAGSSTAALTSRYVIKPLLRMARFGHLTEMSENGNQFRELNDSNLTVSCDSGALCLLCCDARVAGS
jgi:hypothetical protein